MAKGKCLLPPKILWLSLSLRFRRKLTATELVVLFLIYVAPLGAFGIADSILPSAVDPENMNVVSNA
jgi:hypothetical protein